MRSVELTWVLPWALERYLDRGPYPWIFMDRAVLWMGQHTNFYNCMWFDFACMHVIQCINYKIPSQIRRHAHLLLRREIPHGWHAGFFCLTRTSSTTTCGASSMTFLSNGLPREPSSSIGLHFSMPWPPCCFKPRWKELACSFQCHATACMRSIQHHRIYHSTSAANSVRYVFQERVFYNN